MSPLLFQRDGFRFRIYSREGVEPPHVHVQRAAARAKYWLEPVRRAEARGFTARELARIERIVREEQDFLLRRWHEHFARFPPQQARRSRDDR